jgi:plastocyanin
MTRLLIVAALAAFSSVASAQAVSVHLSEWKVDLARDTVAAGPVTFKVQNNGTMSHAFHVQGQGLDKETLPIAAGQTASLTVRLKAGTYDVYCPMSDLSHKGAGMLKKIVVTDAATAPKKPD